MKKKWINIHHTAMFANDDLEEQFDKVDEGHKKRWNGKTLSKTGHYGGYHYLIERNGVVRQFRGEEEVGAHNNILFMNYRSIGVCFAGNMSVQDLTNEQVEAGFKMIKEIQERLGIVDKNIKNHRHFKATQCPGNNITDHGNRPAWDYIKERHESIKLAKETWRLDAEKWAAKYVKDMPGLLGEYDPHRWIMLIKRAVEDKD